jgi:hypothetical protein
MNRENRIWLAFAGAASVPAIVFGVATPLSGIHDVASIAGTVLVLTPWSGAAVFGIGGPLYLLCVRFGRVRWWSVLLSGAVGGLLAVNLFGWPNAPSDWALALWTAAGVASGLVFWLLHPKSSGTQSRGQHER